MRKHSIPRLFLKIETEDTFTRIDITDKNIMIKRADCELYNSVSVHDLIKNMPPFQPIEESCKKCSYLSCKIRASQCEPDEQELHEKSFIKELRFKIKALKISVISISIILAVTLLSLLLQLAQLQRTGKRKTRTHVGFVLCILLPIGQCKTWLICQCVFPLYHRRFHQNRTFDQPSKCSREVNFQECFQCLLSSIVL